MHVFQLPFQLTIINCTLLTMTWTPLHREQRHMADIEHIFKKEGICTSQAAIKHLAAYQAHAFLLNSLITHIQSGVGLERERKGLLNYSRSKRKKKGPHLTMCGMQSTSVYCVCVYRCFQVYMCLQNLLLTVNIL